MCLAWNAQLKACSHEPCFLLTFTGKLQLAWSVLDCHSGDVQAMVVATPHRGTQVEAVAATPSRDTLNRGATHR